MKIITVNIPTSYLKAIDTFIGENGLFPSRSELFRVAVRDFLIHEMDTAKSFEGYKPNYVPVPSSTTVAQPIPDMLTQIIQIPTSAPDPVTGQPDYKTYRIIKKESRPVQEPRNLEFDVPQTGYSPGNMSAAELQKRIKVVESPKPKAMSG
jgi:hypothetical protein